MAKCSIKSSVFHLAGSDAIMNRFQTLNCNIHSSFPLILCVEGCKEPQEWSCAVRGIFHGGKEAYRGWTPPRWSLGGRASHLDQQKRNGEVVSEGITI